ALRDSDTSGRISGEADVARLWDICNVPDYRKIAPANHAELVIALFGHLQTDGVIPEDWIAQQIGFCDRVDGDIDTLSNRIAHIRTWTYVANRPDWLRDPGYWSDTTRAVEDRLSDALHECLTQRFVDRRTAVLMKRLRETETLEAHVDQSGELHVENHFVGRIEGLVFHPDQTTEAQHGKAIRAAAQRVLSTTLRDRAEALAIAPDTAITLETNGRILWSGATIGRLERSDDMLLPRTVLNADDQLTGAARDRAAQRLERWVETQARTLIKPLFDLREAESLEGVARGLAFRLVEGFGILPRAEIADEVKALEQDVRAKMRALGVRFGAYHLFVPTLLKPAPRTLLAQLHTLQSGEDIEKLTNVLALAASGRTSVPADPALDASLYRSVGYRVCGKMAVRVDILERLADLIRPLVGWRQVEGVAAPRPDGAEPGNAFTATVAMTSLVGCAGEEFASILRALDYRSETVKRPAPAPEGTEVTATETANAPQVAAPAPDAEPAETPVGETGAETPPATAPSAEMTDTSINTPPETTNEAPAEVSDAPETSSDASMIEVVVWRPRPPQNRNRQRRPDGAADGDQNKAPRPSRNRGQGRNTRADQASGSRPDQGEGGKPGRKGFKGQRNNKPGKGRPETGNAPQKPQRPPREPDPNSPFAALAALKQKMETGTDT
ncbi:MAG: helicase, partial [Pseudomonadota bacterium]